MPPADRSANGRATTQGQLFPPGEAVGVADIRDALVIKERDLFLMTDAEGNVPTPAEAGYGLYKNDTRYLSLYDLSLDGVRPIVLLSTAELGFGSEHHLTNPSMSTSDGRTLPKDTLEIRRQRVIGGSLLETVQVSNFNPFGVTVRLRFDFAADFVDIFEVQGARRPQRGTQFPPSVDGDRVVWAYKGLDGVARRTEISFSPAPDRLWERGAVCSISLGHRDTATITVTVTPDGDSSREGGFPVEFNKLADSYRDWIGACTQIYTDNDFFDAMLDRSFSDLRMLNVTGENGGFVAAGIPWFSALFGRDSLITASQMLAFNPGLARNVLRNLARWQGTKVDGWRDEQPGKILHELRVGEMASAGEIPMTPYYGTVDATPLFLMLAAEYLSWTDDLDLMRELEPHLMRALAWIDASARSGESGYLEYAKRSERGLVNQGWKDSHDGIVNGDGSLVRPPVALSEVQGYVYAAKRGATAIVDALGRNELSSRLRRAAGALKRRFNQDYWMKDQRFFALALGADGRAATSITSDPGQCLWTGIVQRSKAPFVARRLFANDMFSGWGIRTLSSGEARYNPLGYHLGTVWPHDNSLIGMGLKRYGFEDELNELATAIYDCCRSFEYYRLPELFSGVPRTAHGQPVRYPVACRPQAWAAGTVPLLLQAILGLAPNAHRQELRIVSPKLPYWLQEVEVRGLRVGSGSVDLYYKASGGKTRVSVTRNDGVRVRRYRHWPQQ